MATLYHIPLSPYSRKIRLALTELGQPFDVVLEPVWERRPEFLALNPAGTVPVLAMAEEAGTGPVLAGSGVICEFLDETVERRSLLGESPVERAEVRRLAAWFDDKFGQEVTAYLYGEKVLKRLSGMGGPDSTVMRAGRQNIHYHLDYIGWLTERRTWLAGGYFSLADITAGAHLSVLDYLGDVPWSEHEAAKLWYQRIKSRPSFRPLLADRMPGFRPSTHYDDLDF